MWVLDNNRYLGELPDWDRGHQFGDGLFETMVVKNERIQNLELHAHRMQKGVQVLGIHLPEPPESLLAHQVDRLLSESEQTDGLVKVIVTRGNSSRGYKIPDDIKANVYGFLSPLPSYPQSLYEQGVDVRTCQTLCSLQPQLAGVKHLNRLENVLAAQELSTIDKQFHEGLMFNANHQLIEGTMSNVFLESHGRLTTPSLDESGVAGTMREKIIKLCARHEIPLDISEISQSDLEKTQSLFMCNAVMGIWPVATVDGQTKQIGVLTQRLMQLIQE